MRYRLVDDEYAVLGVFDTFGDVFAAAYASMGSVTVEIEYMMGTRKVWMGIAWFHDGREVEL